MSEPTRAQRIVADYAANVPFLVIMRRYVCSSLTVMKAIRAANIPLRGKYRRFAWKPRQGGVYMTDAEINEPGGTELDMDNVLALSEQRTRDVALDVARSLARTKYRAKILDEPAELYAAARRESGIK